MAVESSIVENKLRKLRISSHLQCALAMTSPEEGGSPKVTFLSNRRRLASESDDALSQLIAAKRGLKLANSVGDLRFVISFSCTQKHSHGRSKHCSKTVALLDAFKSTTTLHVCHIPGANNPADVSSRSLPLPPFLNVTSVAGRPRIVHPQNQKRRKE